MTDQGIFTSQGDAPHLLVLGGGVAGIAAAVEAAERGLRVTVVERKPFLGGRAYSFHDRVSGRELDNGQHVLIAGYRNFRRLLEQLGSARQVAFQPRLDICYRDAAGVESVMRAGPGPAPLHLGQALLGFSSLSAWEKLSMVRPALALLLASDVETSQTSREAARTTLAEVLDRFGQSPRARTLFWESLALATLNGKLEDVSALSMARVLSAGFAGHAPNAPMGLPRAGLSDIIGRPALRRLTQLGVSLMCKRSVTSIRRGEEGGPRWSVELNGGERLEADHVISALEPHVLSSVLAEDVRGVCPELRGLEGIRYSPIVSAHALFDAPVRLSTPFMALVNAETQWIFDAAHLQGSGGRGHLSLTISGADRVASLPKRELHALLKDELRRFVPEARGAGEPRIVSVKEKSATILPSPEVEALRPGVTLVRARGLHLAGAWTQTGFPSTLEGAAMSGYRAVEAALAEMGERASIVRPLDERSWLVRSMVAGLHRIDQLVPGWLVGARALHSRTQ